jgi:hypothetical protein
MHRYDPPNHNSHSASVGGLIDRLPNQPAMVTSSASDFSSPSATAGATRQQQYQQPLAPLTAATAGTAAIRQHEQQYQQSLAPSAAMTAVLRQYQQQSLAQLEEKMLVSAQHQANAAMVRPQLLPPPPVLFLYQLCVPCCSGSIVSVLQLFIRTKPCLILCARAKGLVGHARFRLHSRAMS